MSGLPDECAGVPTSTLEAQVQQPPLKWSREYSAMAVAEGWDVFDNNEVGLEIERIDAPGDDGGELLEPPFASDREAIAHVYFKAQEGSALHQIALHVTLHAMKNYGLLVGVADRASGAAQVSDAEIAGGTKDALILRLFNAAGAAMADRGMTKNGPASWVTAGGKHAGKDWRELEIKGHDSHWQDKGFEAEFTYTITSGQRETRRVAALEEALAILDEPLLVIAPTAKPDNESSKLMTWLNARALVDFGKGFEQLDERDQDYLRGKADDENISPLENELGGTSDSQYHGEEERVDAAYEQQLRDRADQVICDSAGDSGEQRLLVTFIPKYWVTRGDAPPIYDAKKIEFDATEDLLSLKVEELQRLEDGNEVTDNIVNAALDDARIKHPVLGGPYAVEMAQKLAEFFGVDHVSNITEEMLDSARERHGIEAPLNGASP